MKEDSKFLKVINNKVVIFVSFTLLLILKELFFSWIWSSNGNIASLQIFNPYMYWPKLIIHIFFAITLSSGVFLFNKKGRIIYVILVDLLFTVMLLFDIAYYRQYGNFLSARYLFYGDLFNPLNKNLLCFYKRDILVFVDFIILIPLGVLSFRSKAGNESKRSIKAFIIIFTINGILIYGSHYLIDIKGESNGRLTLFVKSFAPQVNMDDLGPIGYHEYDLESFILGRKKALNNEEKTEINQWFEANKEELPDNKYKGIGKGKNLIIIQWESMEDFAINYKVDGQALTPNMNKLLKHSLYFDNIFEQNNNGTTSDAELMTNTSLIPVRKGSYFLEYSWEKQSNTLQRILMRNGYTTATAISDKGGVWNWLENHKSFGAEKIWDSSSFVLNEPIGTHPSDGSYLSQVADKMKTLKSPYYIFTETSTSHGPFDLPKSFRELKLPKDIDDTKLGGYFQSIRYTDKSIGEFLNKLNDEGILKDSIVVIYGDHGGINKYYKKELEGINYAGNKWNQKYLKVPLLIYSPDIKGETINTYGGLVDVLPTVSYILGIDRNEFENTSMGRVLVNTNRNATMNSWGDILGYPKNEAEVQHLKDMFKISDDVIQSGYFVKNN